jgi:DNA-binding CsgD family transcriptional regulator
MQPPCDNATPRISESAFAQSILAIVTSRSLEALAYAFHDEIARLIGSESVGLYAYADERPRLILSRQTPEGFLRDYEERSEHGDPLVDRMLDRGHAVDGFTEMGAANWRRSGSFDLLQRWGYRHCLGGALNVDGRVVAVVYTASGARDRPYGPKLRERMNVLCHAGGLAIGSMIEAGTIDAEPRRWVMPSIPGAARRSRAAALPPRLREVAALLTVGQTNKEIARALGLSDHTVKEYVSSLCRRMEVRNRTELARGLIEDRLAYAGTA